MEKVIRVPFIQMNEVQPSSVKSGEIFEYRTTVSSKGKKQKTPVTLAYESCASLQYFHNIYSIS